MELPEHRKWMYNRLILEQIGPTNEFISKVEEFVSYAGQLLTYVEGTIKCPYVKCDYRKLQNVDMVKLHLY